MSSDLPIFTRLSDFEAFADAHAHEFPHIQSLGGIAQKTRDRLNAAGETDDANVAQIEVETLHFHLRNGDLASAYAWTDRDNSPKEWPDIRAFHEEQRSHLKRRLQSTKNPTLIARYAHVLWNAGERQVQYARQAVDSYLDSVDSYVCEDIRKPGDHFGLLVSETTVAACRIALSINPKFQSGNLVKSLLK